MAKMFLEDRSRGANYTVHLYTF